MVAFAFDQGPDGEDRRLLKDWPMAAQSQLYQDARRVAFGRAKAEGSARSRMVDPVEFADESFMWAMNQPRTHTLKSWKIVIEWRVRAVATDRFRHNRAESLRETRVARERANCALQDNSTAMEYKESLISLKKEIARLGGDSEFVGKPRGMVRPMRKASRIAIIMKYGGVDKQTAKQLIAFGDRALEMMKR